MNVAEFLDLATEIVPDRPATLFEGRTRSFAELRERSIRVAGALSSLGVGKGDRVAILDVNTDEYVATFLASARLGSVFVPLNFRARADELRFMLNDSGAKVLLAGPAYHDLVGSLTGGLHSGLQVISVGAQDVAWPSLDSLAEAAGSEADSFSTDGQDTAMLLFTAGTTGTPKGVMLSHESFSSYLLANVEPADPEVEERMLLSVPLYHVAGMQSMMAAIFGGRSLVVQRQFEPLQWMDLVERERVTRTTLVPTMLKMVMDHPEFPRRDLSSLEVVSYGAAPMPLEVIKRAITSLPGVRFINAFGQTETGATITMLPPEDHNLSGPPAQVEKRLRRLSSIGRPLEDVEVRIVDEGGASVPPGQVGEIVARGPRLMKGYWNRAEATAEAIRGGWLYTGDLGYMDEDGYIYLSGRAKDFIKRGGEMVSPEEVERVLQSYPAIEEAAVIGVPDAHWGESVRAVVVPKKGCALDKDEVIEYCRQRLASFKKPESIVVVDALPRNALGKVLKRVLREQHGRSHL
jgi:acyl-CoA synthetase (AMP-forming)/AMP-acid ligase II